MASRTSEATFETRISILLQGVPTSDLSTANRKIALRQAVAQYNLDLPKHKVAEFAGDAGSYYNVHGYFVSVDEDNRDQSIALQGTDSGADEQLAIKFTLDYPKDIYQIDLYLRRIGATVAGTVVVDLYTADTNDLPDELIGSSAEVDIDDDDGCRRGIFKFVEFHFSDPILDLPAGDYCAVLREGATSYTYASGTSEVQLGVDQSSVTADVSAYDGSSWAAYGTDSQGIIRVLGCLPNWQHGSARIAGVEYPAATISSDGSPQMLEPDDYQMFQSKDGWWLYFPNHAPGTTNTVRLWFSQPYVWIEAATPMIDTPEIHFEAICNLAAANACEWLATRYGQNADSSFTADVVDHQNMDVDYRELAKVFGKQYLKLTGLEKLAMAPAFEIMDMDLPGVVGEDFIFHGRKMR